MMLATPEQQAQKIINDAHFYEIQELDDIGATEVNINFKLLAEEIAQAIHQAVAPLQNNERILLAEIAHLRLVKLAARAHLAEWESGDTFAHDTRKALKQALEGEG